VIEVHAIVARRWSGRREATDTLRSFRASIYYRFSMILRS
jgi:hypothetical protein